MSPNMAHDVTGFVDSSISVALSLYKSFDTDDVHSAVDENTIIMYLEKLEVRRLYAYKWQKVDLHVMNKWAINRISDKMLDYVK